MNSSTSTISKNRCAGLDLIRAFAILFVIGGHFFLNTDFNSTTFHGFEMFALSAWQTLILINVPLFLILTGYLNLNKKVSKKYYIGGLRVIVTYLIISLITILFRELILDEHFSPLKWFLKITDFSVIPYGWYIEMWIGLFLLTPFLNILWKSIESKRHRQILILTLFVLVALPDFFNRYGIQLVPGFWVALYPTLFFYIGAYIREYQPDPNKSKLWLAIIGLCLINPLLNVVVSFISPRPMLHLIGASSGIIAVPLAALFFTAFYRVDFKSGAIKKSLRCISLYTLDMYLISWIFDQTVYPFVKLLITPANPLPWLTIWIMAVPMVFLLSFLFSIITYHLQNWILKPIIKRYDSVIKTAPYI